MRTQIHLRTGFWMGDSLIKDMVHNMKVTKISPNKTNADKGSCQKRFSGFCPLRGGGTPLSAKLF